MAPALNSKKAQGFAVEGALLIEGPNSTINNLAEGNITS